MKFFLSIIFIALSSIIFAQTTDSRTSLKLTEQKFKNFNKGKTRAPNFLLQNKDSETVQLKQFSGKWIILNFWSSWNPWFLKDLPALKEAADTYSEDLIIIGIDCNESKEEWLAALDKYQMPWINLYNPGNNTIVNDYAIYSYPAKIIIGPDGMIKYASIGDDPEFYEELEVFMYKDDAEEERMRQNIYRLIGF